MAKHTHIIRRQQPTKCLSVFGHFVKLAPKGLTVKVTGNSTHKNTKWLKSYYIKIIRSVTESKASIAKVFLHELNNQQFEAT